MKTYLAILLALLSPLALADDVQLNWVGTYEPISKACQSDKLVIKKTTISWGSDCKDVKISNVLVTAMQYTFKIEENNACSLSRQVISIKPEPSSITKAGFGVSVYDETDKSFAYGSYCYFKKIRG